MRHTITIFTRRHLLLLFFISFSFIGKAQLIDAKDKTDSTLDSLMDVAKESYYNNDLRRTIEIANLIIDISDSIVYEKSLYYKARGYNTIAIAHFELNSIEEAKQNWTKALDYSTQSNDYMYLHKIHNNLGILFSSEDQMEFEKSIDNYKKADYYLKKIEGQPGLDILYTNIAIAYFEIKDFETGMTYIAKVKDQIEKSDNFRSKISLYVLMGQYLTHQEKFEEAYAYFDKAISLGEKENFLTNTSEAYSKYAEALKEGNRNEEAYHMLNKHLESINVLHDQRILRENKAAITKFNIKQFQRDLDFAEKERLLQEKKVNTSKMVSIIVAIFSLFLIGMLVSLYKNLIAKKELSNTLKNKNEELNKSKSEIEKLLKLKSNFFSTVSHELRTPLYGVIGLSSLLLEGNRFKGQDKKYLQSLKFSGDYLLNLINDVLLISKMESNTLKIKNAPFDIRKLIDGIIDSLKYNATENNNKVHKHIDFDVPTMLVGDSLKISQVLVNLIGNALKFTKNGDVWVLVQLQDFENEKVKINFQIKDNGPGISEDHQKEIFDTFFQVERDEKNQQKGSGLGLTIVSKILNQFNTNIRLKSKESMGSCFEFSLFFEYNNDILSNHMAIPEDSNLYYFTKPILIVEDNRINQIVTQNILKSKGIRSDMVDNGADAIEAIKREEYALILMDLNMPKMSGYEATKKIREFNSDIPIVALTATTLDNIKEELSTSGFNDIIIKPYEKSEFYQTLYRNASNTLSFKRVRRIRANVELNN